jgi:putative transposase
MSAPDRRALVDRDDPVLPVAAQCRLLKIARSTLYYRPAAVEPDDLALMRRMDELYLTSPFYGSRRMVAVLRREGLIVNRKRVRRLMRLMGLEAIYQKPNTSQGHPDHKVYPYLRRGLSIEQPNQVWCADITYIPMARGFVYLVAVMDWFSRRVLSWRLSITMEAEFCVEAVQEALAKHGRPEILTPIRVCSSPAPGSWMNWRPRGCGSAWTVRGGFWTTSSSSGPGGASNMKKCLPRRMAR